MATLSLFFRENNSPSRAAKQPHVHPNPVAYRLRRAAEITGLRLDIVGDSQRTCCTSASRAAPGGV